MAFHASVNLDMVDILFEKYALYFENSYNLESSCTIALSFSDSNKLLKPCSFMVRLVQIYDPLEGISCFYTPLLCCNVSIGIRIKC